MSRLVSSPLAPLTTEIPFTFYSLYELTSITEDWAYLLQLIQASQPKNASQHTPIIKYFQGFFHLTELCLQLRTSSSVTLCWVTRTRDLSKKVFGNILIYLPMISSKTLLFELKTKKTCFFPPSLSCCTLNQELEEETQKLKSRTVCSLHSTSARTKCCFGVGSVNRSVFPFFTRKQ